MAPGDVDDRSIEDVSAHDLTGYVQCHFFAGIGGWSLALRLAEWPDDRPVWTGSCPCQPLSGAGQRKGHADERHLWSAFYSLIAECRPATVFGEQVASKDGREWLAGVRADLEDVGYACGAADMPAAGVAAPHIRQRLWWVGQWLDNTAGPRQFSPRRWKSEKPQGRQRLPGVGCQDGRMADAERDTGRQGRVADQSRESATASQERAHAEPGRCGSVGGLAHADGRDACAEREQRGGEQRQQPENGGTLGGLGDTEGTGSQRERSLEGTAGEGRIGQPGPSGSDGFWDAAESIPCGDGKARRIESGTFPLAHGVRGRVGRLRAYGNAIVPQVAAKFIEVVMDVA